VEIKKGKKSKLEVRERKYFYCREFRHIVYNCRNRRNIKKNRRVEIKGLEH